MKKILFFFIIISVAIIWVAGVFSLVLATSEPIEYTLGFLILYTVASLSSVGPTELGAILIFGKPVQEVGSGLQLVPIFFCTLVKETRLVVQDQFPGDPEKVDKTDSDITAPGKVSPIRVTCGASGGTDDPIDIRMTVEVSLLSRYRIEKGQFLTFLTTIGSTEEARRQIRDTVEAVLKSEFAKKSPKEILADYANINLILRTAVETLTNSWGIKVEDVQIVDIDLGKKVNQSLRDVPAALLQKKVTLTNAEAEMQKRIKEGKGSAEAQKLFLQAQAVGYKKIANELGITEGALILSLQTMKESFEKANYSVIPGSDAFAFAAGLSETLKKMGG